MNSRYTKLLYALGAATMTITALAAPKPDTPLEWTTVINNNDLIPPLEQRTFNSYNQPSVNTEGLVVMRARSRGGPPLGPATHGIYTRDMSIADSEIVRILDRSTLVPQPNNLGSKFVGDTRQSLTGASLPAGRRQRNAGRYYRNLHKRF
jgi:hypothetical protein